MAENKDEVAKGRGCGCGGACKGEAATSVYGYRLAQKAIIEMNEPKPEEVAKKDAEEDIQADVDAFLENCDISSRHPLDVVAYIAKREGIELSGEPPKDETKRKIYELLKAVVKKVVVGMLVYLADKYGFGIGSLVNTIFNSCGKMVRQEQVNNVRPKVLRVVPIGLAYAFSW